MNQYIPETELQKNKTPVMVKQARKKSCASTFHRMLKWNCTLWICMRLLRNCTPIQDKEYQAFTSQGIYFPASTEHLTITMAIDSMLL